MSKEVRLRNSNKIVAGFSNSNLFEPFGYGEVTDVYLDESKVSPASIGAVEYKSENGNVGIAYPFDKNFISLPIKNETIELYRKIINGEPIGLVFYRKILVSSFVNFSNAKNEIQNAYGTISSTSNPNSQNYQETQITKTPNTNNSNEEKNIGFGEYFEAQKDIHKLKLYEGDTLIESRFGQSIRFSAYNNGLGKDRKFAPTIIIRNSENEKSKKELISVATEENLKEDGSIIAITSGEYEIDFNGGSEFSKMETKPESFKEYPSKLKDDQILINSGRLILSSKNGEMIFYSKKNYGFISDGQLSIDNKFGMFAKLGGEFNLKTNNQKISLLGGSGKIYLNTESENEPIARATTLVNILKELIGEIKKLQFLTPSGPSKIGPENIPAFDTIVSKLDSIKSTLNFTE